MCGSTMCCPSLVFRSRDTACIRNRRFRPSASFPECSTWQELQLGVKGLPLVVRGSVVTAQACFVRHVARKSQRGRGTRCSSWSKQRARKTADPWCKHSGCAEPARRRSSREPAPAMLTESQKRHLRNISRSREILQVDALRQGFRGANAGHASVPQSHDGVDRAQNEQRIGSGNV